MLSTLTRLAKEIIEQCNLATDTAHCPNREVIGIIKREFEQQYMSLTNNNKVVVLNKYKDLWATRTIVDSANLEYNQDLFEKVFQFAELCKKVNEQYLVVVHN